MLDNRTRIAFYNGLVLPHLDYADTVWGDQPSLKTKMEKLQSFQNKFAKKIKLGKMSSSEALKSLNWLPLVGRRLSHRCTAVQNAIKGDIPQHFESFKSTLRVHMATTLDMVRVMVRLGLGLDSCVTFPPSWCYIPPFRCYIPPFLVLHSPLWVLHPSPLICIIYTVWFSSFRIERLWANHMKLAQMACIGSLYLIIYFWLF